MADRATFRLVIRDVANDAELRPLYPRLRFVLKALLRAYGFRCVTIEELPPAGASPGATEPAGVVGRAGDRRRSSNLPAS